jgi:predicted dithiol-disulfide oxidoreductase (DUF899 family)
VADAWDLGWTIRRGLPDHFRLIPTPYSKLKAFQKRMGWRRALPWVKVEKEYVFDGPNGRHPE